MTPFPWYLREAGANDRAYIVQTWRSSLRSTREHNHKSSQEFRRDVDAHIDRITERRDTSALVAAPNKSDTVTIAGWIVYTPMASSIVVHYLYVRRAARATGCGRLLADAAGVFDAPQVLYTFRGPRAADLLSKVEALYVPPSSFI